MLSAIQLSKHFGARPIFRNLNFQVPRGAVAAVTGANGSGKSTLLKIIAGLLRPASGRLQWEEEEGGCGYFAPDAPLYRELTVRENLLFFAAAREAPGTVDDQLERFCLAARAAQPVGDLSSGWRARLQLAVATLGTPGVLLLDEPSSHLDEPGLELLQGVLEAQRAHGLALLATNSPVEAGRCDFSIRL